MVEFFKDGYLHNYTFMMFELYSVACRQKCRGRYSYKEYDNVLFALDGYSKITKRPRSLLMICKFIRNVLCCDLDAFEEILPITTYRNRYGKFVDFDKCVDAGKKR